MTTLPPSCRLALVLALSNASAPAPALVTNPACPEGLISAPQAREWFATSGQPVLLALNLWRIFGGSKEKEEEERSVPAPSTPAPTPTEKPRPAEPMPVAPPAPTPSPPPLERPTPPPLQPLAPPVPKDRTLEGPVPRPAPSVQPVPKPPTLAPAPIPHQPPAKTQAPPPEQLSGLALARLVYDRDTGRDAVAVVEMILTSHSGQTRVRRFESKTLSHGGLQDSLVRFTFPADIEDTAFLTLERQGDDAEQFLYLPALRRVRRIVAKQKGKSFVNSDLYYQDLERRAPEKDRHRIIGDGRFGQWHCWVLESVPREGDSSAYGKTVAWIDQATLVPVKGEFFDRKQDKIKSSVVHRLERLDGIWTVMDSEVTTLESQHTTRLTVQEIHYNTGLSSGDFTKRGLQR